MTASSETDQLPSIEEVIARFRARRLAVEAAEAAAEAAVATARKLREAFERDLAAIGA
jgi:hypothetical protein